MLILQAYAYLTSADLKTLDAGEPCGCIYIGRPNNTLNPDQALDQKVALTQSC